MPTDKEVKAEFRAKASAAPDKYYATNVLKKEGFLRKQCPKCKTFFWTADEKREFCGNAVCSGGYGFIGNSPAKNKMEYVEVWERFSDMFRKAGYTPIKRYPVVARWRDDAYFVQASIYDFQPYVVSGEILPPANPLVIPQFCLRFNDIDNVGITSAHFTGFVMIGQHAFMPPEKYEQEKYFTDIHNWLKKGIGLPNKEIIYHEDSWAGGGNFGPSMEFYSRGIELGNQVYMWYEKHGAGVRDLKIKVLDMGMGHERNTWFCKGTSTIYDAVFPTVMGKLYKISGLKSNLDFMKDFLPYSSFLNLDETENIEKAWQFVAEKLKMKPRELKREILPLAALYSVGEHARTLLVALSDGALPSNTGGGYNLRVLLRRALSFIEKYGWKVELPQICEWHATYLKQLFPELKENLGVVSKILDVEKEKYLATKQASRQIVERIIKEDVTDEVLLKIYDTQGIPPEIIKEEARKAGKIVKIPDGFYARVSELHEHEEQAAATEKEEKLELDKINDTPALYFDDYKLVKFSAKVLRIINNVIVLDKTAFYPTSGGQVHDTGTLNGQKVAEVFKQGNVILHRLAEAPRFKEGDSVDGEIDFDNRKQLAQHHTATHIVNAAARKILGSHINQAGAKKTREKAHLDITHYENITKEELDKIEEEANRIVKENITVYLSFMPRNEAEKKYGMSIYQGGAVPGRMIRIVEIPSIDVEACGGTHVNRTSEVERIKILKSSKIADGIVRIFFTAGEAAKREEKAEESIAEEAARLLGVPVEVVPARTQELFMAWKKARKAEKKGSKINPKELELKTKQKFEGDVLAKTAEILKTQPEYIAKTIKRFLDEIEEIKKKL